MMPGSAKDRAVHSWTKRGSRSSPSTHEFQRKEPYGHTKDKILQTTSMTLENKWLNKAHSLCTVSYVDEPSQSADASGLTVQMENTYHLGPTKHFPAVAVNRILRDVLTTYLQEEKYEPDFCRQLTKTISEVIKAKVKGLMIPRYKFIVIIHIGQLTSQSIHIGSRCLWDTKNDNFSSYAFRNSSLFAVANVYAIYFE